MLSYDESYAPTPCEEEKLRKMKIPKLNRFTTCNNLYDNFYFKIFNFIIIVHNFSCIQTNNNQILRFNVIFFLLNKHLNQSSRLFFPLLQVYIPFPLLYSMIFF